VNNKSPTSSQNRFTVIDSNRSIAPRPDSRLEPAVRAHLAQLLQKADGRDAHGILELALTGEFAGKTAVVSSFGAESAVLLHLMATVDPNTPVLFLNTGKLFGETLRWATAPSTMRTVRCGRAMPMLAAISARPCRWPRCWRLSPPR
jgi:hypothetical protein